MLARFAQVSTPRFIARVRIAVMTFAACLSVGLVQAQDTRTVVEPTYPATCTALAAQQAITGGEPASETMLDTSRIQAALTACPTGQAVELTLGGTNNVNDAFLTGALNIPGGVTLIVDGGVTLFGSRNPADYQSSVSGAETCGTVGTLGNGCSALIQINGGNASSGSGVMGFGVINGRGGDKLLLNGVTQTYSWWDLANQANGNGAQNNPILLYAKNAANFTLYKITLVNSPMFHVKYQDASGFTVWGVKIVTPYSARNTDGIDPDDKISNVTINNSYISDGDDDIAIGASGSNNAVSNVTVENTHTYSGHGLSIGSYTSGGVSNVLMQNITMAGNTSDNNSGGLKIKSAADRGGLVNNVQYNNVCIQNVRAPLQFNPFYNTNAGSSYPSYQNIGLHGVTIAATAGSTIQLEGYNANNPLGITFDNLNVSGSFALSPNPQYAGIAIGPGPVTPASLQTINPTANGSVGVVYSGSITNPSQAPYVCPATAFQSLAGELYLSTATTNNQKTISLPNPASFTLNAVVEATEAANPAPTSSIQFYEGANLVGTAALGSNGTLASVTLTGVTSGVHTYTATYPKDSFYAAMPFGSVTVNVNTTGSTTSMTANPTAASFGATVALTATVAPSAGTAVPTGSVTFQSGSTVVGVATLNGQGVAVLNALTLPVGNDQVAAFYTGSSSFGVSDSSATPVNVSISKAATSTPVGAAPATTTYGGNVILTADIVPVTSGIPTGTVTFMDGATILGTAVAGPSLFPNYSEAQLTVSYLGAGNHTITAVYGGDNNYIGSTSSQGAPETVLKSPTTTAVTFTPPSIAYGSTVTITATVNTGLITAATGTITFIDTTTSTTLGTVAIVGTTGSASYTTQALTAGTHNIQAIYSGDVDYLTSTSALTPLVVSKAASTTTVAATGTTITFGTNDTISATVSPASTGVPSGSVTFMDGTTTLGTATLFGGKASISTSTLSTGSHSITVSYSGDSNFSSSTSTALLITVTVAPTTTVVNVPGPITYGASALLTASVSSTAAGTLTGTITFKDGNTVLGSGAVSGGSASFTATGLGGGLHSITATYSGDQNFGTSTSAAATLTVNKATTTSGISAAPTSINYGSSTVLTAAVTPGSASGSFTFFDGAVSIGTAAITNGVATLTTSTLTGGSHSITATYSGDNNYSASTTSSVTVTVSQASSTVSLSANPTTITYLNSTILSAAVTSGATGTVIFSDGATTLGSATIASGVATFTATNLMGGLHNIKAVYSGDQNFLGSSSSVVVVTVNPAPSTTTVAANPATFFYGNSTILTATLANATGTGTVTFKDGTTTIGTATLANGTASLSLTTLSTGPHTITANYSGDANYGASSSAGISVTVNQVTPVVSLAANPTSITFGSSTTLTATITPSTVTGTVTFVDSVSGTLGTGTVTNGVASFSTSSLTAGNHNITAVYGGDVNDTTATSAATIVSVGLLATTTTLSAQPTTLTLGGSTTLSATVSPVTVTGSVTFKDGPVVLGGSNLAGGAASFTASTLAAGTHSITATYSGDNNNATSTSAAVTVTVNKLSQTISLSSIPSSVTYGAAPVTITASATSSLPVSLTVTGPATLNGNILSFTGAGTVTVTATQAGNATYAAAPNVVVTVVVAGTPTTTTLSLSAGSVYAGQSVTLTANVGSSAGAPATGTVTFLNGLTTVGTGPVTNGVATLVLTNLPVGVDSLTASFAASGNYAGSVSSVATLTVVAPVTLALNPTSLSLAAGTSGTSTLSVTPVGGFTGSVSVACSSPVPYITCTVVSPVSITGTTAATSIVTVTVAGTYGELRMPQVGPSSRSSLIAFASLLPFGALLLLPVIGRRRRILSRGGFRGLTLLLMAAGLALAVSGCAGSGSITPSLPPAGAQAVTISATANSATVTTTLTVNVTN